eukprot:CAMPEP_0206332586 /NCGR_PEP_ID=MMETSP0106_2-20121207/24843_1 /ASSEMBLY_ACC=CAM_ASM_000206 /TAXON_ID=81532 /ORGANISM="Acanthoeca-like sp., Strain 10tr" /LENGTH=180 /DNA_ID=CAMNT_0053765445 /DNA_START=23 /DNA_END=562 /DNA_ORIENTATION=-
MAYAFSQDSAEGGIHATTLDQLATSADMHMVPRPPTPGGNPCGRTNGCLVMRGTDGVGSGPDGRVTLVGKVLNSSWEQCCDLCTANSTCEMYAFGDLGAHRVPGEGARATCWLLTDVLGTKPSGDRNAGCPQRDAPQPPPPPPTPLPPGTAWSVGISGQVAALPPGFSHETIVTAGSGIT